MKRALPEKPLNWVGSAKDDLLEFPDVVVDDFGYALYLVQIGGKPPNARPWKGEGAGVFEIIEDQQRIHDRFKAATEDYEVRYWMKSGAPHLKEFEPPPRSPSRWT